MKELNQITNEIIKESEELLEHLENDLELEQIKNELVELEYQEKQFKRNAKLIGMATGLYSLMLLVRIFIA